MACTVYIMRGLPGSGKSTAARHIAGDTGIIHSTDDFHVIDGVYRFQPDRLEEFHSRNFAEFCKSLAVGIPVIVLDNTNIERREFEPYVRAARDAGYDVKFVTMAHPAPEVAAQKNTHGVPLAAIKRMLKRWES